MSIADSGLNRHLGEPNLVFERLCQTLCRQLAKAAAPTAHVVESMIYAHNYDGGTDAVVVMSSGHRVAIEAKAYATIEQEIQSITASFTRMLSVAEHTGVTHYLWCSTFKRNVSAVGRDIDDTIRCLEALSGTRGVTVKFVGLGDIRQNLQLDLAELDQLYFGQAVVPAAQIVDYTKGKLDSLRDRVSGPAGIELHFNSKLEAVLDTFTSSRLDQPLTTGRLKELVDELSYRMTQCTPEPAPIIELHALLSGFLDSVGGVNSQDFDASILCQQLFEYETRLAELLVTPTETDRVRGSYEMKRLKAVGISVRAIDRELHHLTSMAQALRSQVLVVSGPWGTGKTYNLARHLDKHAGSTRSLLLRAKHFTREGASLLGQSWRDGLIPPQVSENGILAILDTLAPEDGVSILAIDGLNEWPGEVDPVQQLRRLVERLPRFQHVKVIATLRSTDPNPSMGLAEYRHVSPDRAYVARVLAKELGQPVVPYWSGALTNPLTARIAAKVASNNPQGSRSLLSPISFSDLARQWVELLGHEYAGGNPDRSSAVVRELVDALAREGGRASRAQLRRAIGGTEQSNNAIDYLVTNGCFEDLGDDMTFLWERMAQLSRARLLAASDRETAARKLADMDAEEQSIYLGLLADECPLGDRPTELPEWLKGFEGDLLPHFVDSLTMRASDKYTDATLKLAAKALRSTELAQAVCYAVLSNPLGAPGTVSPGWLADELKTMSHLQRERVWPKALNDCLTDEARQRVRHSDEYSDMVSSVTTWMALDACNWTAVQQHNAARMLIWFASDANRWPGSIYEYAVRQLTELLHMNPDLAQALSEDCLTVRDEYLYEIVTAAALGVLLRWPQDLNSVASGRTVRDAMHSARPQMYRTLANLFRIERNLSSAPESMDFSEFLGRIGRVTGPVIWDELVAGTQRLIGLRVHDYRCRTDKTKDIIDQRRFTYEFASLSTRRRIFDLSPRSPRLDSTIREFLIEEFLKSHKRRGYTDPTVPVSASISYSDRVHQQWWALRGRPVTLADITVTDATGVRWIILNGRFRQLNPPGHPIRERIWLSKAITGGRRDPDLGLPAPGRHVNQLLELHTTFVGAPSSEDVAPLDEESIYPTGFFWADAIHSGRETETSWTAAGENDHNLPGPGLTGLLSCSWTGNHLDYQRDGVTMITDPALVAGTGPRALLARAEPLLEALQMQNVTATVEVVFPDPNFSRFELWHEHDDVHTIQIG